MQEQKIVRTKESASIDFEYALFWNRQTLKPLGLWSLNEDASKLERCTRLIALIISICVVAVYMIPQYLYLTLSNPEKHVVFQILPPQLFDILAIIKLIILALNTDEISYCLGCMRNDWSEVTLETDRQIMCKEAKFGRFVTVCCITFMYTGISFYNVVLPFLHEDSSLARADNETTRKKPLPYPINYVFFDQHSSPTYEITWIIQTIGSLYMCILNCGCYGLIAALVAHVCGQLQILCSRFEDLTDGNRGELPTIRERLEALVRRYVYLIGYNRYLNKSFQVIFLVDNVGGLSGTCFLGYMALMKWNENKSVVGVFVFACLLIAYLFNLFVISFVGQKLWNQSQTLSISTNGVKCYAMPTKITRSYLMCILTASRPLKLSAFNMLDISLETFGQVLKGSVVFLNMVREVTGK